MSKGTKMFETMIVKAEAEKARLQARIVVIEEAIAEVDSKIAKLKSIVNDIESVKAKPVVQESLVQEC